MEKLAFWNAGNLEAEILFRNICALTIFFRSDEEVVLQMLNLV